MRVAMLTELFPPHVGGQEVRFRELARSLVERGHGVEVYCVRHDASLSEEDVDAGIKVHRYPLAATYQKSRIPGLPRSVSSVAKFSWWCRTVAKERRHDVYVCNQWPLLHIALLPGHARHRTLADWCETRGGVYRFWQRALPRLVARNMAVSGSVARVIQRGSQADVPVVASGIFVEQYGAKMGSDRNGLLYLGRLSPHKRIPLLIEAYAELHRRGFDEPLRIVGGGVAESDIRRAVAALPAPVRSRVSVTGMVTEAEKIGFLQDSKILVLPSAREGFPRVVAEAMACGLPAVTTNDEGNGTKDVLREYGAGIVCDPNADSIVAAIYRANSAWSELSNAGLVAAERLDWRVVSTQFEAILASVLQDVGPV